MIPTLPGPDHPPRPTPRYLRPPGREPVAVINPKVLWASEAMKNDCDGYPDIPGIHGRGPRPNALRRRYPDREAHSVAREFSGIPAPDARHIER